MKRIYYRPGTGRPTCPLPADKYHTNLFLKAGFTLEPPEVKIQSTELYLVPKVEELPKGEGNCPVCGKKCKRVKTHYKMTHMKVEITEIKRGG